jgi:uncharacterized protein involved in response to NO
MLLILLIFWLCDGVFLLAIRDQSPALASGALMAALNTILLLVTIIAGRIVPAFTGNALRKAGVEIKMRSRSVWDRVLIALMAAILVGDAVLPQVQAMAIPAALAGVLHLWRLSGWYGWRAGKEPIVWILHIAYAWLPIGLLMKALFLFSGQAWTAHWMHALSVGTATIMILAVMTRASLGHTGRALKAAPLTVAAYLLMLGAALIRVFGPSTLPLSYTTTIAIASVLWICAFVCFLVVYTPILVMPRVDGKKG